MLAQIVNATARRDQATRNQQWRYNYWVHMFDTAINDAANMGQTKYVATFAPNFARNDDLWLQKALNDFVRARFKVFTTIDPTNAYYSTITFEW